MEAFNYYNPTRLINGLDKHLEIGEILKSDDIESVLLVYGRSSIKKSGLYDEILEILNSSNIKVIEHGGVKSNPVLSHTRAGVEKAKSEGVQAILAVGGGSVVDESKAIAAGALLDRDVWDLFLGNKTYKALPLYTILTLSATGSEMNSGAVVTNEDTLEKFSFSSPATFPRVSIVNPAFTFNLPMDYLAYSAVDAITHTLEVYFTAKEMPLMKRRFIENIVITVMESTKAILEDPKDYNARAEFSLATTWALNGLTTVGVGKYGFPNHMIEHSLSAIYDVPHGAGLAVVLPAWMKWYKDENRIVFERFAQKIFNLNTAEEGIVALENWFSSIGAPVKLNQLNVGDINNLEVAENAFLTSKKWGMASIYSVEEINKILDIAQ
jgi:NADP-dependent alcohol dehydrogenase